MHSSFSNAAALLLHTLPSSTHPLPSPPFQFSLRLPLSLSVTLSLPPSLPPCLPASLPPPSLSPLSQPFWAAAADTVIFSEGEWRVDLILSLLLGGG